MTVGDVLKITKGILRQGERDKRLRRVTIDSRTVKEGDLFIAVRGKRFDAHRFVGEVARRGASAVVISKRVSCPPGIAVIVVKDTVKALGQVAAWHRRQFGIPLIAVTGSAGKTTTKDMIAAVLSCRYKVLKNPKTENNHFGVPLTLLRLNHHHEIIVLELGTNQPGDIRWLARISAPTVAVITNIGNAHLEKLRNRAGVYREKVQLIKHVAPGGTVIVNQDDDYLCKIRKMDLEQRVLGYSRKTDADYTARGITRDGNRRLRFVVKRKAFTIASPVAHNVSNALAAISCGELFKIGYNDTRYALERFHFFDGRQRILRQDGVWIIDDTYNANPLSLESAVKTLDTLQIRGKRIVVCADMLELGNRSKALHEAAGRMIARSTAAIVLTYGPQARFIARGIKNTGSSKQVYVCASLLDVHRHLKNSCLSGDAVLVKGSRGMRMERTVEFLKKSFRNLQVK